MSNDKTFNTKEEAQEGLAEIQSEIVRERESLSGIVSAINREKLVLEGFSSKQNDAQNVLNDLLSKKADIENQIDIKNDDLSSVNESIADANRSFEKKKKDHANALSELSVSVQKTQSDTDIRKAGILGEYESFKNEHTQKASDKMKEIEELDTQIVSKHTERDEIIVIIGNLKVTKNSLEEQIPPLQDSVDTLKRSHSGLDSSLTEKKSQDSQIVEQIQKHTSDLTDIKSNIDSANTELETVKTNIVSANVELDAVKKDTADYVKQKMDLSNVKNALLQKEAFIKNKYVAAGLPYEE